MYSEFAREDLDPNCTLYQVYDQPKQTSYIAAKLLLEEAYQDSYGIFNYMQHAKALKAGTEKPRPLASIAVHESEKNFYNYRLSRLLDRYINCDFGKYTGMSFKEYMALTKTDADSLVEACERHKKLQLAADDKALNDIKK